MNMWTVLVTCVYTVAISQSKANQCGTNCISCSTINGEISCTKCSVGYWLSGTTCLSCSNNCASCSNASSCETCKPGFYSPDSYCNSPCSANCLDGLCNENTGHCNQCPSSRYGYYCGFDCGLCQHELCVLRKCTDGCKAGYWQNQHGNFSKCSPCITNCSLCDNGSTCNVCNDGTFIYTDDDDKTRCITCPSSCEKCSSYISCSSCKPGYFGPVCEFNCTKQIPYCYLCDWDGATTVTCSDCDSGYTLQDNKCMLDSQQCPLNCEKCTISNVCELCKTGWYGELCDKSCRDISNCEACEEMNDSVMCTVCNEGYTVMNGECIETTTKPTSTIRTDCRDIPNCNSCDKLDNFTVCSLCDDGYEVMNGECRSITSEQTTMSSTPITSKVDCNDVDNCVTCLEANGSISCSECVEGYTTKDGTCQLTTCPGSSSADICGRCALESSSARFQVTTFVIGLVTGIGIAIFVMTLIIVLCYFLRRKYFQHCNQSTSHSIHDPFYENSPAANESAIVRSGRINQETSQQMDILEGQRSTVYEGMNLEPSHDESASGIHYQTSTDKDQNEYFSLGTRQVEHVYKGNENGRNL